MHLGRRDFITFLGGAVTALPIAWLAARAQQNDRVRAWQIRVLRLRAEGAADSIEQFIQAIKAQIGWTTQLPWTAWASDTQLDQHRFDTLRLLRQAPAVTGVVQIDANGKERLRESRLANEKIESGADFTREPEFMVAMEKGEYYGPIFYRRESEPYMKMSLAGRPRPAGVSVALLGIKFVWAVVSQIKVGEHGVAYIIDPNGRLIFHPDISLAVANTDMTRLPQVMAARAVPTEPVQVMKDIKGRELLVAHAAVKPLGWLVFVELPVDEANALVQ